MLYALSEGRISSDFSRSELGLCFGGRLEKVGMALFRGCGRVRKGVDGEPRVKMTNNNRTMMAKS